MADPISHATQGALMMLAPFINRLHKRTHLWFLAAIGGFFGVLPDLVAVFGFFVLNDEGRLYRSAHYGELREIFQYVPMYALHLAVDSQTHNAAREWYGWNVRIWLQSILWVLNLVLIVWYMRIWKRNTGRRG